MIVTLENQQINCEEGTTLYDLSRKFQENYKYPIIVARVDGRIQELYHTVCDGSQIEFCTTEDSDGHRAYIRGLSMLLVKAVNKEMPKEEYEQLIIHFSIDSGYFCQFSGKVELTRELLDRIEKRMRSYV